MQRLTKQRKSVQESFRKFENFLSVQEIHNELTSSGNSIGLSTVYRIIGEMHSSNELDMVSSSNGESLYRLCSVKHHHHLVCETCGTAIELFDDLVESWARKMAKENRFRLNSHFIELSGTCSKCS